MPNLSHLKALIKKNLLVYKGTLVLTLIELLFPILVIFLFWRLRALFKIVIVTVDDDEKYYEERNKYFSYNNLKDSSYDSMKFHPYYSYCKNNNKFIALIGDNFPLDYFNKIYGDTLRIYSSLKELNNYIESPKYGTDKIFYPEICFGLTSYHRNNKYEFRFHFFASGYSYYLPDIPSCRSGVLDPFSNQPNFSSYKRYTERGFLFFLKSIYDLILMTETNNEFADISFDELPDTYLSEYVLSDTGKSGWRCTICSWIPTRESATRWWKCWFC